MVQKTHCFMCGVDVVVTDDDETPRCDKCQGEWAEALAIQAIMDGEIPIDEQETEEDEDGDSD